MGGKLQSDVPRCLVVMVALACLWTGEASAYTVKATESGATVRWNMDTIGMRLDPSVDAYLPDSALPDVLRQAAVAWVGLPGVPDIIISEGLPRERGFHTEGASNGVYVVHEWPLASSSLAVAVTTFESTTGKILDADILINGNHPYGQIAGGDSLKIGRKPSVFDFQAVMTHEMGHVLGLGESYDERFATMWPNIARGETHQRILHSDDELGVMDIYRGEVLESPSGCASATLAQNPERTGALPALALLGLLVAAVWLGPRMALRARRLVVIVLAVAALLVVTRLGGSAAADSDGDRLRVLKTLALRHQPPAERDLALADAVRASAPEVRVTAAIVIEQVGGRNHLALASRLALDPDERVAAAGAGLLSKLLARAPRRRVAADDPEAKARLSGLLAEGSRIIQGTTLRLGTQMRDGMVWSRYMVASGNESFEIEVPGGMWGEITQTIGSHSNPIDGQQVVVSLREGGPAAWAHLRDGAVYGGWLGDGPAIDWSL